MPAKSQIISPHERSAINSTVRREAPPIGFHTVRVYDSTSVPPRTNRIRFTRDPTVNPGQLTFLRMPIQFVGDVSPTVCESWVWVASSSPVETREESR